jgi:HSP20 family protein
MIRWRLASKNWDRLFGRFLMAAAARKNIMNTLKRWNQLRDMETFQHNLDSLLRHSSTLHPPMQQEPVVAPEWSPLVDISEDDREYLIKAELPEVKKEDVKVTAEAGMLTIMGERKFENGDQGKKYHRVERAYGTFGRSFSLPTDANPAKVSAEFKDGLLTVHLVKEEKAKPAQIEVTIS